MTFEEFKIANKALGDKYHTLMQENCDLWTMVNGFLYYTKDNEFIVHVKGIWYDRHDGKLCGDFEGYINILTEELQKFYGY